MSARVTMKDIAAELGVSINTVHKALTGKAGVSESVRAKVNAKAEEMGYHRNTSASSLRRKDINLVFCLPRASREERTFSVTCGKAAIAFEQEVIDQALRLSVLNLAWAATLMRSSKSMSACKWARRSTACLPTFRATTVRPICWNRLPRRAWQSSSSMAIVRTSTVWAPVWLVIRTAGSLMAEQAVNLVHAAGVDARVLLLTATLYRFALSNRPCLPQLPARTRYSMAGRGSCRCPCASQTTRARA